MAVYFLIYTLIGVFPLLVNQLSSQPEKKHKYYSIVCGILIILLLAMRHQSMGVDLGYGMDVGYLSSFDKISKFTWKQAFTQEVFHYERGYIIFNKFVSCIWNDKQFFLAVCALVSVAPVIYVIYQKSHNAIFSYYIYMGLPSFLMLFSGIRQSIAIGVCFLSFSFIEDKKLIKFILSVFIAYLFHFTSIICLLAYPLYHIKVNNLGRVFSLALLPIIYLFRYPLFSLLSPIFKDEVLPDDNGAITLLLIFVLIYVFCIIFARKEKQVNGLLNLFYLACVCQIFSGIYSTAMRVGYYFMIFAILLIPHIIEKLRENTKIKVILTFVTSIAFILFGLYLLYNSTFAQAYPYVFFWR